MIQSIRDLIAARAAEHGDLPFLVFDDDGRSVTYSDLARETERVGRIVTHAGVAKGEAVAILLANTPEFVFTYLGVMCAGAVANPVNCQLTSREIQYVLEHSQAKVLFASYEFVDRVAAVRDRLPKLELVVFVDGESEAPKGTVSFSRALDCARGSTASPVPIESDDAAMIIYTSGTTGHPKGVVLTHRNLLRDARDLTKWFGFAPDVRMGCVLPLFHVNGEVVTTITPLYFGGSVVLFKKFHSSRFWHAVHEHRIHVVSVVPTILYMLIHQSHVDPKLDVSSARFFICGAAPLPVELQKQFEAKFGIPIVEGYGLSETTCYSSMNPLDGRRKLGSVGLPIGNEMRIVDDDGSDCAPGTLGEIVIRGENVMRGYFGMEQATADAMRGGWFHSGDLGMRDADGFFYCVDRKKDMIIRGGYKIYPREIDEILHTHPRVLDAATIGVPNPVYGEEVKSFIVVRPGTNVDRQEILDYCHENLAHFKCPKNVVFVDEIPKGPTGKPLKRVLREIG
ncbi:MAG: long-chain-fatty-acid--CoA ligase [Planctomycetes bacterium]|nr:long-chain-fatty-acid--CoA ligase [Planctomycetota bacterium]